MNDDALGCFGLLIPAAVIWAILHFSGHSILFWREEKTASTGEFTVTCQYFNSTGTESIFRFFYNKAAADTFYCPRTKVLGQIQ